MIPLIKTYYNDHYTWSHFVGDYCIAHHDGVVSILVEWDGLDCELGNQIERRNAFERVYSLLSHLQEDFFYELHLWRDPDSSLVDKYLAFNDRHVRGGDFGKMIRQDYANHLRPYGISNRVGLVITTTPKTKFSFTVKRRLINQSKLSITLEEHARVVASLLPGGKLAECSAYLNAIAGTYDHARKLSKQLSSYDPSLPINDQVVTKAPVVEDGLLKLGDNYSKVLLLYLYPEVDDLAGWFVGMSSVNVSMHVVQIINPLNTKKAVQDSEKEQQLGEGLKSRSGNSYQQQQINALGSFTQTVAANNLSIFKNAYVVTLHGDKSNLKQHAAMITEYIERGGGQVRQEDYMQLPNWRISQPGQGYLSPFLRPDSSIQLAHMAPVQTFNDGHVEPELLWLGESGQLIGTNYTKAPLLHSFTVAITGGGKGVKKVKEICETYPLGVDWYISEIGSSYKWVVEAFGGSYSKIDPRNTCVNPLPLFSVASPNQDKPLDAILCGSTIGALSFLLTDGDTNLNIDQKAAAQTALQNLYRNESKDQDAPTLPAYLSSLEDSTFSSKAQETEATFMAGKLHSFLDTTEGAPFRGQDSLNLSEGITGVDLKDVDRASKDLLKYYLVFIALRFNHLAFARRKTSISLLDEMHKFIRIAPDVMGALISELGRMGRKEASFVDLVTQGVKEIDVIETEVLNSMQIRSLLYREDEHDLIADRIRMPSGVVDTWKGLPYPLELDWRPCIYGVGQDYYNLHLTFPQSLLDLADTSGHGLDFKDEIDLLTNDPMERLSLFRQRMESRL